MPPQTLQRPETNDAGASTAEFPRRAWELCGWVGAGTFLHLIVPMLRVGMPPQTLQRPETNDAGASIAEFPRRAWEL